MAVTTTTRMGVTRWSSDSDAYSRAQMDSSHAALEANAGGFLQGLKAARPSAGAAYARFLYWATDESILYNCDGSAWFSVNASNVAPGAIAPGDTAAAGSALTLAKSDHRHSMPAWGVVGEVANVGTAAAEGVTAKFARIDHVHVLGNNSVTAGKIAAGGVSAANQLANDVVTTAAILNNNVTKAKLSIDMQFLPGLILPYGGTVLPSGYLWCDGTGYSTSTYSDLFAAIAYRYGGSGATFNVPDFRDRFPRGQATTGAAVTSGGADTVTLATGNLPSHTHGVSSIVVAAVADHFHGVSITTDVVNLAHTHTFSDVSDSQGSHSHTFTFPVIVQVLSSPNDYIEIEAIADGNDVIWNTISATPAAGAHTHTVSGTTSAMSANATHAHLVSGNTASAGTHTHVLSGTTDAAGSGTALDVRPKFQTCNFIIKV